VTVVGRQQGELQLRTNHTPIVAVGGVIVAAIRL
jgi:hypothetical protein